MAGHSHSANIKFRKDRVDAARAKAFSKVARMITVAAKLGGGEPDANPRLRLALEKARAVSMPKDNIERAIKKGIGDVGDRDYEEILYEGYGPHGVAVLLEILTDNRNRVAPEIRVIFDRSGGNLGASGSVAWMFERKAVFAVRGGVGVTEERVLELALDAGAEDVDATGDDFEVRAAAADFEALRAALVAGGLDGVSGEVRYVATTSVEIDDVDAARQVLRCLDALEDNDDVQTVCSNVEFSDRVLTALAQEGTDGR